MKQNYKIEYIFYKNHSKSEYKNPKLQTQNYKLQTSNIRSEIKF